MAGLFRSVSRGACDLRCPAGWRRARQAGGGPVTIGRCPARWAPIQVLAAPVQSGRVGPIELNLPNVGDFATRKAYMAQQHPDLADEQAFIDHAYVCLARSRDDAWRIRDLTETGRGGTHQARWEADMFEGTIVTRLGQLDLFGAALVFGRIDRIADLNDEMVHESYHIGRLAVSDDQREPVVVDWRAPVAEPFYRATGRDPMGLVRRRHFIIKGSALQGIEDELFGEGQLGIGSTVGDAEIRGYSTLIAALEEGRTGQLGDIVATIQAEQDEIIRSPHAGVLVVQGGPGTGKTVVALHRAAYLLYTHRFPLEDQGLLVVGPNRLFLRYIAKVLPSLGEAGVAQVVLADLIPDVTFGSQVETPLAAFVKGDVRMSNVLAKAVRDRQRPLKHDLVIPFSTGRLTLSAAVSTDIVAAARRRFRRHNAARRFVEGEVFAALANSSRDELTTDFVHEKLKHNEDIRIALERMWPVLTPAQLLHDLFGSAALVRSATAKFLTEEEAAALLRPRVEHIGDARWTDADAALLDEARALLGPRPAKPGKTTEAEEIRTYGHIVVDEVQDLTPMHLRMIERRSLNGSMTVVGDLGQATGAHAPDDWADVLCHLPDQRDPRMVELSVGYRIPAAAMELAAKVLAVAAPQLHPPRSVRSTDDRPEIVASSASDLLATIVAQVRADVARIGAGNLAVVTPASLFEAIADALGEAGLKVGRATREGLDETITVVPVGLVKGLELDAVVVVEPARIVREEQQGLRALYVALTRSTRRLSIVHAEPLPDVLLD
jgi:DNA helicase IV